MLSWSSMPFSSWMMIWTVISVFNILALPATVAAGLVPAQAEPTPPLDKRQDIFPCFKPCLIQSVIAAGCNLGQPTCFCESNVFFEVAAACFAANCTDQQALWAVEYGEQICSSTVGRSITLDSSVNAILATKTTAGTSGALAGATSSSSSASASATPSTSAKSSASRNDGAVAVMVAAALLLLLPATGLLL